MATGDVRRFLDQVDSNPALQETLMQAQGQFVQAGKDRGFDFTAEDLHDELRQRWGINKPMDDPHTCTFIPL